MARRRMIDPSIWEDEHVGRLSDAAFRVFVACISNADDEGKLEGGALRIGRLAFSYNRKMTEEAVEKMLSEVACNLRSFVRYCVNGRKYIKLMKWKEYQTIDRPRPSRIPDPSDTNRLQIDDVSASNQTQIDGASTLKERKGKECKGSSTATAVAVGLAVSGKGHFSDPIPPDGPTTFNANGRTHTPTGVCIGDYMARLTQKYPGFAQVLDENRYRAQVGSAVKFLLSNNPPEAVCSQIEAWFAYEGDDFEFARKNYYRPDGFLAFCKAQGVLRYDG